jgi:hypothetical protein
MSATNRVEHQVSWERQRRRPLGIAALVGGALMLIGSLLPFVVLSGIPNVGVVQSFTPLLHGQANPATSPRYPLIHYYSHHSWELILGSVIVAAGFFALAFVLHFLFGVIRFRRPESMNAAGYIVLYLPPLLGVASVANEVAQAILAHRYLKPTHSHTNHAADQALGHAPVTIGLATITFILGIALVVGIGSVSLNAMRTGIFTRGLAYVGMAVGVLIVLGFGPVGQVVPGLWLMSLGVLLHGQWPKGDPPAWEAGVSVPWQTVYEEMDERKKAREARDAGEPEPAAPAVNGDVAPEPRPAPASGASSSARRKRRRKGGGARR